MVYALTLVSALVVALGEVVQQRSAALAPREYNLSPRLLWWLVRRPRWLVGVVCALVGNAVFALALARGSVVLVEAVFVSRLIFALGVAAVWDQHGVPAREVLGALAITVGLVAFLVAGDPSQPSGAPIPDLHWAIGGGTVVGVALILAAIGARLPAAGKAALLGSASGLLFGIQASLTQTAIEVMRDGGVLGLLTTWSGYAVVAVALLGMLLVQSAFEIAPIDASYPAVVTGQLLCAIAIGTWVLGGSLRLDPSRLGVLVPALLLMIAGIYVVTCSPMVAGSPSAEPDRSRE